MSKLRLAGVIRESIVDGPGIRFVVFAQGCPHRCEGCHNAQTHDFNGGYFSNCDDLIKAISRDKLLKGVTFSGGEPFCQALEFSNLAKKIHALGLDVITYTGFTIEQLLEGMDDKNNWRDLLEQTDILVDGRFILEQRSLQLKFRGSKNQRFINPKESLEKNCVVEIKDF